MQQQQANEQGATAMHQGMEQQQQLQQQLLQMQHRIIEQELALQQLQQKQNQYEKLKDEQGLPEYLQDIIPAHPQQARFLQDDDRRKLLRGIPKYEGLEPVTDKNGLATKGMAADKKKWITKDLVNIQKEYMDIIRVAANAITAIQESPEESAQMVQDSLETIAKLAADSVQKSAGLQLQQCLEFAKATGSEYLIKYEDNENFSHEDRNIFQQAHLDAVKEFKRFAKQVESAKEGPKKDRNFDRPRNRGGGRGNGGGGWGRPYNSYNNYYSGGGGRGGRGRGRGNGRQDGQRQYNNQESKNP
jgi:hypothetical protein